MLLGVVSAAWLSIALLGQSVGQPARGLPRPTDAWPTYHGDDTGQHYSPLTQINQKTVTRLAQIWSYRVNTTTTTPINGGTVSQAVQVRLTPGAAAGGLIKATPLYVQGVIYLSAPDHAWAIDARTGREIWHYYWRTTGGEYLGNRGMAIYKSWVYFGTPDGHLVSLDAATGQERWHRQIGDMNQNYYVSTAPVVVKDKIILGPSGDALDVPGWLEARDPDTGAQIWRWSTTPAPGEPGAETWPDAFSMKHGGGMVWQPVTYDPELNLIFVGVGNPNPMYAPERRNGANLYSCSIVALNADSGKLVWYFQTSRNEAWDFDANQVPVLIDTLIDGRPRKLVAQATRNGMYFLLDRITGKSLLSSQFIESANWSLGFNEDGQPVRNDAKLGQQGGALISPSNGGAQNWAPPAYSPDTGLLYMNVQQGFDIHYTFPVPETMTGNAGHQAQSVGGYDMSLRALDVKTGRLRWVHRYAGSEWTPPRPNMLGGILATAGGLVFAGAPGGYMVASHPETGRQLWHAILPDRATEAKRNVSNTPITYMMDGRQYLVFAADDTLYAYALVD